jgi:hypothetical protein
MLSKIIGISTVLILFMIPASADAHTTRANVHVSAPPIVVSWTWVAGHFVYRTFWVRGHWSHPAHGKSYRAHRHGPPPVHAHAPPPKHHHKPRHYRKHR